MAITLKKKTLAIIIIVVFLLSIIATAYIFWTIQKEEEVTPGEGEAGLGLIVGEYGCRNDDDCIGQYVQCDERMDHVVSKQRCEYYQCPTGYTLSSDKLSCTSSTGEDLEPDTDEGLNCGEYGCFDDSDCVDENNQCNEVLDHDITKQRCMLLKTACPDGYIRAADKCTCELIEEATPTCGDGEINVSGEQCEEGDPSGASCYWSSCNQTTCKCPTCGDGDINVSGEQCESGDPSGVSCSWSSCNQSTCKCPTCGDGLLNVSGEECEVNNPSGVSCTWSECSQSSCTCPEEVVADEDENEDEELPETGISDISDEMMAFYITFFISGGVLVLSYVLESPE
ncbi:MAG: hypothetical protein ABIC57_00755, partial [bacterium]